ncbi:antitoxin Xre/MbcA/ParS toxin-binding domain-containing protein [Halomonas garicola]|uniref:antitoxin Xre/MbcA/ParS toxin-binding domain-containing protein n=1 Tax=Halomonas garicola TaxID=1690008 RepID=UPI0035DE6895
MLINLFAYWQITTDEQLSLLGLAKDKQKTLTHERDKLKRASVLLDIHKSLRLLFPHNRELVYGWMTQPNRAFNGATPVQIIDERGMVGLYMTWCGLIWMCRGTGRHGF